mmetsp:Transcript_38149/g.94845  ORF Transcript_38149/g.94845 Transcript_38149/m.94845 type:complete len:93 (-) Transcript_38149:456-734(-)
MLQKPLKRTYTGCQRKEMDCSTRESCGGTFSPAARKTMFPVMQDAPLPDLPIPLTAQQFQQVKILSTPLGITLQGMRPRDVTIPHHASVKCT